MSVENKNEAIQLSDNFSPEDFAKAFFEKKSPGKEEEVKKILDSKTEELKKPPTEVQKAIKRINSADNNTKNSAKKPKITISNEVAGAVSVNGRKNITTYGNKTNTEENVFIAEKKPNSNIFVDGEEI